MITIYHNPRCRKSRQGLEILKQSGKNFKVIRYMDERLSEAELKQIITILGINPLDLVRQNEAIWKSDYKSKSLTDADIISAMVQHPKLIERPIVVNENSAVIGRPPELIVGIL